MSMLKTLKLVAAKPAPADAKGRNREKLVRYLVEQKALVAAHLAGEPFNATRVVTRKDEAGNRTRVEAPRHVRRGWFTDTSGGLFFTLRYGGQAPGAGQGHDRHLGGKTGSPARCHRHPDQGRRSR